MLSRLDQNQLKTYTPDVKTDQDQDLLSSFKTGWRIELAY